MNDATATQILQEIRNLVHELSRIRQALAHLAAVTQNK